uniref:TBC1 domain family member 19 n=1 Tax=Schistosoma curassoni TaxID=6186 RepID=A0A183JQ11_9TREM
LLLDDLKGASRNEIDHLCELLLEGDSFQALKNWAFTHKPTILLQLKQNIANEHYLNNSCCCSYLKKAQVCHFHRFESDFTDFISEQSVIKPVFGPKDLLDVLTSIKHPQVRSTFKHYNSSMTATWGLINLPINVKNLSDLRRFYEPLHIKNPQIGVDNSLPSTFELVHEQEAKEVISLDSSERAQQFLRRGCPLGYRARLWALCLNAKVTEHLVQHIADYSSMNVSRNFTQNKAHQISSLIACVIQATIKIKAFQDLN